jgi:hypothetical protein
MPVTEGATTEVFEEIEPVYFSGEDFDATAHELSVSPN